MNKAEQAQLKQMEEAEMCPTCGGPMKNIEETGPEHVLGPAQGGRSGMLAKVTRTEFPGYRRRTLKKGEKISGM